MTHLLTQVCIMYENPTLDKFGNPNDWEEFKLLKCRFVESKRFRRDAQNREFEIEGMLTTTNQIKINSRVETNNLDYRVISCTAMTSPTGVIGYTSELVKYKNLI
jgi:hypothetical protein